MHAITNIRGVLRKGAIGWITIKDGTGEQIESDKRINSGYNQRLWSYYCHDEFTDIIKRNNFDILDSYKESNNSSWIIYFVKLKE